jgi:hypothetical protein
MLHSLCDEKTYGTQLAYTSKSEREALIPSSVCKDPIRTLSGCIRSLMAVPSAKNSGLERISKRQLGFELASSIVRIDSAVRQGTVDFSTTILDEVATLAI